MSEIAAAVAPRPAAVPDGYMQDASGHLVPVDKVKPEHKLEDELVRDLHAEAELWSMALAGFKARAFERVRSFLDLLAQEYAARGGAKGNVTLTSYDGSVRVQLAIGEFLSFGPELQVAKTLVDECIRGWSEGANSNLRTIVLDAFQVDQQGKINTDRVLALRRLDITDATWQRAMEAIGNAVRVTRSKEYIRFYKRPSPDADFVQVSLDFAKVAL